MLRHGGSILQSALLLIFLLNSALGADHHSQFSIGGLGKYSAGFQVETITDPSRKYKRQNGTEIERSIRVSIWYPAQKTAVAPLTLKRLAAVACGQWIETDRDEAKCLRELAAEVPESVSRAELQRTLDRDTASYFEIPAVPGSHPVVFLDSGMNVSSFYFFPLCEYLSSHGYIVIALPSFSEHSGEQLGFDQHGFDTKLADLRVVIETWKKKSAQEHGRFALLAWSVGGLSSARVALTDSNVAAFVSLDSGTGYDYGELSLREDEIPSRLYSFAYLQLRGASPNRFKVPTTELFFTRLGARAKKEILIAGMNHGSFLAPGGAIPFASENVSRTSRAFHSGQMEMARQVLKFLNCYLAGRG